MKENIDPKGYLKHFAGFVLFQLFLFNLFPEAGQMVNPFWWWLSVALIGLLFSYLIGNIKEKLDTVPDKNDVLAGILGSLTISFFYLAKILVVTLFNYLLSL